MFDWTTIDDVLLDMDGTLLDLHFDTHFWTEHLPRRYAERHQLTLAEAKGLLLPKMAQLQGSIDWYSIDFWSRELDLDVALLKEEVAHLIALQPQVIPFLQRLRQLGKRVLLVTNAHQRSIELKMRRTPLGEHLDAVVCAHDFGVPKEQPPFWHRLHARHPFNPDRALLIDDTLPVLYAAQDYGIGALLAIRRPNSQLPAHEVTAFPAIEQFGELLPTLERHRRSSFS